MASPRRVIRVEDLDRAVADHEAAGFRMTTIFPADDPRRVDMDGPEAVRLERLGPSVDATGRAGMQYRDLIPDRLGGRFIASHISIPGGGPVPDYVHHHDIRFQMIFCHAGWVEVVYEDQGAPFVMRPGDCVIQPPGIRHRVLESGDGLEVVEIGTPAEHETHRDHDLALPTEAVAPDRAWGGQRFVRHVHADDGWVPATRPGWDEQRFGIAAATDGVAEARLSRTLGPVEPWELATHDLEFVFVFVRAGEVIYADADGSTTLGPADALVVPTDHRHAFGTAGPAEVLVVTLPG